MKYRLALLFALIMFNIVNAHRFAFAQNGGGGQWQSTATTSGTWQVSVTPRMPRLPYQYSVPWHDATGDHLSLNVPYAPGDTVTVYGCGTLSVIMRYQDQQGNLLPAPPNGYFALSCLANWNNGDSTATITKDAADDSLQDPYVQQTTGNYFSPILTGGASGVITHLMD